MAHPIPDPFTWPLPKELVVRALLPALEPEDLPALRLTCRALRPAVEDSIRCVRLADPTPKTLASFLSALKASRLRTLRELSVMTKEYEGGTAVALLAAALPLLPQLTSLTVELGRGGNCAASHSPLVLAAQLSNLQQLQRFEAVSRWGVASRALAAALAQLPALREVRLMGGGRYPPQVAAEILRGTRICVRGPDPPPGGQRLPLPEALLMRSVVLPAATGVPRSLGQVRLACRALRVAVDAALTDYSMFDLSSEYCKLVYFIESLPRLRGLRDIYIEGASDSDLSVLAAAMPQLRQLTGLGLELRRLRVGSPEAPNAGLALAAQLSNLQQLEHFRSPLVTKGELGLWRNTWGQTGWGVADALARLPVLRKLELRCDLTGEVLRRPSDELGADAFRSLEVVIAAGWSTESVQGLARAPLTCLTRLRLYDIKPQPDYRLGHILSGAAWGPHLREVEISAVRMPSAVLSGLQLPHLSRIKLDSIYAMQPEVSFAGCSLPALQSFVADFATVGRDTAASFAALPLPAFTHLELSGSGSPREGILTVLFDLRTPWLPGLRAVTLGGLRDGDLAAMAAAPLTALRELKLPYLGVASATALGNAPWLRGLTKLGVYGAADGAAVALRGGSGGFAELEAAGRVPAWLR